jgi:DNA polymerase-3 subunit epsilon
LDQYVFTLERVLADRLITTAEADALAEVARSDGLSADLVMDAHRAFLGAVAVAAWADGVITAAERQDLDAVARMLGLNTSDVDLALDDAKKVEAALDAMPSAVRLAPGDRVVFTGEASVPRSVLETEATEAGLVVTSSVSKKTRAVVMADPLSESTKARKARELGIEVMAEQVFLTVCAQLRGAFTQA